MVYFVECLLPTWGGFVRYVIAVVLVIGPILNLVAILFLVFGVRFEFYCLLNCCWFVTCCGGLNFDICL